MNNRIIWEDPWANKEGEYVCPTCHGKVTYNCHNPKSSDPNTNWQCTNCGASYESCDLMLKIIKD